MWLTFDYLCLVCMFLDMFVVKQRQFLIILTTLVFSSGLCNTIFLSIFQPVGPSAINEVILSVALNTIYLVSLDLLVIFRLLRYPAWVLYTVFGTL